MARTEPTWRPSTRLPSRPRSRVSVRRPSCCARCRRPVPTPGADARYRRPHVQTLRVLPLHARPKPLCLHHSAFVSTSRAAGVIRLMSPAMSRWVTPASRPSPPTLTDERFHRVATARITARHSGACSCSAAAGRNAEGRWCGCDGRLPNASVPPAGSGRPTTIGRRERVLLVEGAPLRRLLRGRSYEADSGRPRRSADVSLDEDCPDALSLIDCRSRAAHGPETCERLLPLCVVSRHGQRPVRDLPTRGAGRPPHPQSAGRQARRCAPPSEV